MFFKIRQGMKKLGGYPPLVSVLAVLLGSCAVGPDFIPPAPPQVSRYTSPQTPAAFTAGPGETTQKIAMGKTISGQWWELYRSTRLNQMVEQAIAKNPSLTEARATLAQARQAILQAQGAYYPQFDVNASAQRQRTSGLGGGSPATSNLYSVGATVSYNFDFFGGTRRQVEQEAALADYQYYQLAAAYLTLTGNAVTQAINIASISQQIITVQNIIADDEKNLKLVRLKFKGGKAAQSDVLTAKSQLANDRVALPPLRQQLRVAEHALLIAAGKFPGSGTAPEFDLGELSLPVELPLIIPSELVHQRPDILAAEAQLHAKSAAIGVAAAQLYPSVALSASLGSESLTTGALFRSSNQFWSLVANLTAPLFHGGALEAQKQAAIYAFQASAAAYQQTVLTAFGQVADVLRSLENDADLMIVQKNALDTAEASLKLQRLSYMGGKSDLLQLLDAERSYQQARLGYDRALAQRFQDTTQLFLVVGGGWWQNKTLTTSPDAKTGQVPTP